MRRLVSHEHIRRIPINRRSQYMSDNLTRVQRLISETISDKFHFLLPKIVIYLSINGMAVFLRNDFRKGIDPLPVKNMPCQDNHIFSFGFGLMKKLLVNMFHTLSQLFFADCHRFYRLYDIIRKITEKFLLNLFNFLFTFVRKRIFQIFINDFFSVTDDIIINEKNNIRNNIQYAQRQL